MSFLPGVCTSSAAVPYRLFLGTLPSKKIENALLNQFVPVHGWFSSRKRVKEHANEFFELDLSSCDAELILRYCDIPFIRQHVFQELVERQLTLLETSKKPISLPEAGFAECLEEVMSTASQHVSAELAELLSVQKSCSSSIIPQATGKVVDSDLLYLMNTAATASTTCSVPHGTHIEMQARPFLCKNMVMESVIQLAKAFHEEGLPFGATSSSSGPPKAPFALEKRENTLLNRQIPADVVRTGAVEKLRPVDVSALYRFYGERLMQGKDNKGPSYFHQALVGNIFERFATNPVYLSSISMYWARYVGLDSDSSLSTLPDDISRASCGMQLAFPALKLRALHLYTSPDIARRSWRSQEAGLIPLFRLFPLFGRYAAENMAAFLVAESMWKKLPIQSNTNPLQKHVIQEIVSGVGKCAEAFDRNPEELKAFMLDGARQLFSCSEVEECRTAAAALSEKR